MKDKGKEKESKVEEQKYTCESILASKKYTNVQKDLLKALLNPSGEYSLKQVDEILKRELERSVT